MSKKPRLLMTQSLLSAWQWQFKAFDPESAHREFLRTLRREKTRPNQAMLDGIKGENMVTEFCAGAELPQGHEWEEGIRGIGSRVLGCQFQVPAYRDILVDGIPFLLYGRLDGLRAGIIFDIKFSRGYQVGKYLDSPQHPMYFTCVPEAKRFDYVVYTGKDVCVESYTPGETVPIERIIRDFIRYLEDTGLDKLYCEKWEAL